MEDNYLKMASELEEAQTSRRAADTKASKAANQLAALLKKEEGRLRELTESRMENERLKRQVNRGGQH